MEYGASSHEGAEEFSPGRKPRVGSKENESRRDGRNAAKISDLNQQEGIWSSFHP